MISATSTPTPLRDRCAEILSLHRTGVLEGEALRTMAAGQREAIRDDLQIAEANTCREAMTFVIDHTEPHTEAPTHAGLAPDIAECIEKAWAQSLGDAANMQPDEARAAARNGLALAMTVLLPVSQLWRIRRAMAAAND